MTFRGSRPRLVPRVVAAGGDTAWERGSVLGITRKPWGWRGCVSGLGGFLDGWGPGRDATAGWGTGMEPASGCPPTMVCPHSPAGDRDASPNTAAAEPAPGWGCSTPRAGQALPPSRPPPTLSPAEEPCPPWGVPAGMLAWPGRAGHAGDTVGTPQGTPKARQGMSPGPRKGLRGSLGTHQGSTATVADCVPSTGRGKGHLGEHLRGWEKDGAPWGRTQSPSLSPGEGWGTPRMQLWSWEQDRAPQRCISVAGRRMWCPGDAPRAHRCHWERDRASWGYIPGDRKRMGHPGGVPRAHHHHWEKDGAPQGCISGVRRRTGHPRGISPRPGEGRGTPGAHPEPIIATGRRMWHPGDASLGTGKG